MLWRNYDSCRSGRTKKTAALIAQTNFLTSSTLNQWQRICVSYQLDKKSVFED